ncbi:MAG: cupin domain-containing protein [Rhodobiaceae bacterium]|nr:cupin domain-containing protein [Rhodobiaceae bacterium]
MTGTPKKLTRSDWAKDDTVWRGFVEGRTLGTGVTVLFFTTDEIGGGPRLHVHPYDEVFIVRQGEALFRIGDQEIEAKAGDILFGPANVPHKFSNRGPGRLETTDIHLNDRWIQTNLE